MRISIMFARASTHTVSANRATSAACVLFALIGTACRSLDAPTMARRTMPLTLPIAFAIELECYDMPLAQAERLVHSADPNSASLGLRIDEHELRQQLFALAAGDPAIVRAPRPSFVVAPDVSHRAAPRAPDRAHPVGTLASDNVEISVKTGLSLDWQAYDLSLDLRWFQEGGAAPVRFAGDTPMPKDLWLELDALPRKPKSGEGARAWMGFVRALPVWPPTGDL